MIIRINYTALHWDNHQGGSGEPLQDVLIRDVKNDATLQEVKEFALFELKKESARTDTLIGDYLLTNVVIEVR